MHDMNDDDCFYYYSWRNNVVIAFGTSPSLFLFFPLPVFFFCVCACVCVSRMYARAYLAIPCVSADDNVKHTKSNIRYDNKINKMCL